MSEPIKTKRCSKCKQVKPLSDFYKNHARPDGYREYCKICTGEAHKRYAQTDKGKVAKARYQRSERGKIALKRFRIRHPEQRRAVSATNHAVESGKLPRPDTLQCHYGEHPAEQYHHPSYAPEHWLDVVPVCKICHRKVVLPLSVKR